MPPRSTVCSHARDYIVNVVDKSKLEEMAGLQLQIGFHLTGMCFPMSGVPVKVMTLCLWMDSQTKEYSYTAARLIDK